MVKRDASLRSSSSLIPLLNSLALILYVHSIREHEKQSRHVPFAGISLRLKKTMLGTAATRGSERTTRRPKRSESGVVQGMVARSTYLLGGSWLWLLEVYCTWTVRIGGAGFETDVDGKEVSV
jgi:hypothetical protein